jgi:hypothetical protein
VGELKGLKFPLPLSSLMTTCMLPIAPSHAHLGRGERGEREKREKRRGKRNRDFNALLIHFNSCFQTRGRLKLFSLTNFSDETKRDPNMPTYVIHSRVIYSRSTPLQSIIEILSNLNHPPHHLTFLFTLTTTSKQAQQATQMHGNSTGS